MSVFYSCFLVLCFASLASLPVRSAAVHSSGFFWQGRTLLARAWGRVTRMCAGVPTFVCPSLPVPSALCCFSDISPLVFKVCPCFSWGSCRWGTVIELCTNKNLNLKKLVILAEFCLESEELKWHLPCVVLQSLALLLWWGSLQFSVFHVALWVHPLQKCWHRARASLMPALGGETCSYQRSCQGFLFNFFDLG